MKKIKYIHTYDRRLLFAFISAVLLLTFSLTSASLLDLFKLISHSSQSNNKIAVFSQAVSQHFYVSVHSSVVTVKIKAPYLFKKLTKNAPSVKAMFDSLNQAK